MRNTSFCKTDYLYTPFFCEENIWQLINSLTPALLDIKSMYCLFITNPLRKVPLLNQRLAPSNQAVIWDYHVILLASVKQCPVIFDFDTRLDFVTPLDSYLTNTFIFASSESLKLPEELITYIRAIPAATYLNNFYSDRSHMLNIISRSEFPPWPLINETKTNGITTLAEYLNSKSCLNDTHGFFQVDSLETVKQELVSLISVHP